MLDETNLGLEFENKTGADITVTATFTKTPPKTLTIEAEKVTNS